MEVNTVIRRLNSIMLLEIINEKICYRNAAMVLFRGIVAPFFHKIYV